jgi:polyferredoxin
MTRNDKIQRYRSALQLGFFVLFVLAPVTNLLRFDLHEGQLWFMGQRWVLGIDALRAGQVTATQAAWGVLWRGILPALALAGGFLAVAYRYGRLYCGWLCPHFSAVELLNGLLHRAVGKFSLWDPRPTPGAAADGRWWPLFALSCVVLGFVWAISLVSYLLPPREIWPALLGGTLTPNQARFLFIAWGVFTAEFAFARHLFCRFGCAVGLFQSLAWMANPRSLVIAFDRPRARDCRTCGSAATVPKSGSACDNACPMRLNPRNIKRMMFSCVQCGQCLQACDQSQTAQARTPVLVWAVGADAVRETLRQRRAELAQQAGAAPAATAQPSGAP